MDQLLRIWGAAYVDLLEPRARICIRCVPSQSSSAQRLLAEDYSAAVARFFAALCRRDWVLTDRWPGYFYPS